MPTNLAKLNGGYSYLYQRFAGGAPGITAGVFDADGYGHITSGNLDINDGPFSNASYTVACPASTRTSTLR